MCWLHACVLPSCSLRLALHGQVTLLYFAMCISVLYFLTTELVSAGGIGTDTGCAGCRWVERLAQCQEPAHVIVDADLGQEAMEMATHLDREYLGRGRGPHRGSRSVHARPPTSLGLGRRQPCLQGQVRFPHIRQSSILTLCLCILCLPLWRR